MKTNLEQQLSRIIDAVVFQPFGDFSFAGRPSTLWNAYQAPPEDGTQGAPANPVVRSLQNVLYATCYVREFLGTVEELATDMTANAEGWIESLSAANASKDRWEEGWQVQQFLPSGQVSAQKGSLSRTFWPGEFINRSGPGIAPKAGTQIAVYFPREARTIQSGFYFAFGETQALAQDEFPSVRFYWNLNRQGARPLIHSLTALLNRYQVPFRFKVVNHPALLMRSDSAVLYVGRRYYRIASEIALEALGVVPGALDEGVPLFTLPLAKGLAFAEDPGTQESFGMSRCRLLAESLWRSFCEGETQTSDRLTRVSCHFAASGISLERPFLNTATFNSYEFLP